MENPLEESAGLLQPHCVPSAYHVRNFSHLGISSELALGSIGTWSTVTPPRASPRAMAGPMSPASLTNSPCAPSPSAILSKRTVSLQCVPVSAVPNPKVALVDAHLQSPLEINPDDADQRQVPAVVLVPDHVVRLVLVVRPAEDHRGAAIAGHDPVGGEGLGAFHDEARGVAGHVAAAVALFEHVLRQLVELGLAILYELFEVRASLAPFAQRAGQLRHHRADVTHQRHVNRAIDASENTYWKVRSSSPLI